MARKETIYTVDVATNQVLRASKSFQKAVEHGATYTIGTVYICNSEFQDLKKGDQMVDAGDLYEDFQ